MLLSACTAPQSTAKASSQVEAPLDTFIESRLAEQHIAGMAVAIVVDGDVVWAKGYGYADISSKRTVTPSTLFVAASVSKTVVAAGLMHAVETGVLSLDTDINTILPFSVHNPYVKDAVITARHLATHSSGIVDNEKIYESAISYHYGGDNPISLGEFLKGYFTPGGVYYNGKDNFSNIIPGVIWKYSNIGAGLAAYVVEAATGMPFDAYCKKYIFSPLGMISTGWHQRDVDMARHATPYAYKGGQFMPYQHYGLATWPDGGLRTTVLDLGRFLGMVMQGGTLNGVKVMNNSTVCAMLEPQAMGKQSQAIFWHEVLDAKGASRYWGHFGADPGAASFLAFDPEKHVGVVGFINTDNSESISIALHQILFHLFDGAVDTRSIKHGSQSGG